MVWGLKGCGLGRILGLGGGDVGGWAGGGYKCVLGSFGLLVGFVRLLVPGHGGKQGRGHVGVRRGARCLAQQLDS